MKQCVVIWGILQEFAGTGLIRKNANESYLAEYGDRKEKSRRPYRPR